jgi:hypothetical protein
MSAGWVFFGLSAAPVLLLTLAALDAHFSIQRSIRIASKAHCPRCGSLLGRTAVLAGKDRYWSSVSEWVKQNPGLRYRLADPEWEIVCPTCGVTLAFSPVTNRTSETARLTQKLPPAIED